MEKLSVIVLTKNEEKNIGRCLSSVESLSDDIVVMDCYSSDRTVDIARGYTDKVFQNTWPGFSKQRALALSKTRNTWVLWVDADEEVSPELAEEIKTLDFKAGGYQIPRLVHYLGRWIRHGGWYPDYTLRLFNKSQGRFTDVLVHESFSVEGTIRKLKSPLFHYPFRDIGHHLDKINHYTSLAARQMYDRGKRVSIFSALTHAWFRFIRMYLLKMGFLDGRAGLIVAGLGGVYVFLKYIKCWELTNE